MVRIEELPAGPKYFPGGYRRTWFAGRLAGLALANPNRGSYRLLMAYKRARALYPGMGAEVELAFYSALTKIGDLIAAGTKRHQLISIINNQPMDCESPISMVQGAAQSAIRRLLRRGVTLERIAGAINVAQNRIFYNLV